MNLEEFQKAWVDLIRIGWSFWLAQSRKGDHDTRT